MKIALVNPVTSNRIKVLRVERCQQKLISVLGNWTPITLLEIAATLKQSGFSNITIIDGQAENLTFSELVRDVTKEIPDMVVIQATVPTLADDILFSSLLKKNQPDITTVFIGMPATTLSDELLNEQAVDYVVLGEPQDTISELAGYCLNKNTGLSGVLGLGYKDEGRAIINKRRPVSETYDYTTFPDRSLIDNKKYRLSLTGKLFTVIKASRGCNFSCSFCTSRAYYGLGWKSRSPENIVKEISKVNCEQGIDNFLFLADTFNGTNEFVKELTTLIIASGLDIQWVSNSRLDLVSEENVSLMKKSGCILVSLGIETYAEEILKKNKKTLKAEQIDKGIRIFKKYKILTYGYFIFGLEGETRKTILKTIKLAVCSKLDFAIFYSLTPYPGTEYYKVYNNKNWKDYFHGISDIVAYKHLSRLEIKIYRYIALVLFYLHPRRLFKLLRFILLRKLIE